MELKEHFAGRIFSLISETADELGHADAIGPILQGIACPVNDLSRGCSIEDVYRMIAITANQAIAAKANK